MKNICWRLSDKIRMEPLDTAIVGLIDLIFRFSLINAMNIKNSSINFILHSHADAYEISWAFNRNFSKSITYYILTLNRGRFTW